VRRSHLVTKPVMGEQTDDGFLVRTSRQNLVGCRVSLILVAHASESLRKRLIGAVEGTGLFLEPEKQAMAPVLVTEERLWIRRIWCLRKKGAF
jgi:hypothetical protein